MMKSFRPALLVAAAAVVFTASATSARAQLVITEVMSNSGSNGTNDWFEVYNSSPATIDLTGDRMDDNSFMFANSVALVGVSSLAAGQHAVFLESTDATTPGSEVAGFRTFWGGAAATGLIGYYQGSGVSLGSGGDGVELFDSSGTELTEVTFGTATTGASFFGTSTAGTVSTAFTSISVAGQNGAYNSASTAPQNVGSPDVTNVPEPASYALVSLGALVGGGALIRRRVRA